MYPAYPPPTPPFTTDHALSLFKTPFEQSLSAKNRWVRMADFMPWDKLVGVFLASMTQREGRSSVGLRIVLEVMLVKHIEDLSDECTIEYIQENIYAQYFVGLSSFQTDLVLFLIYWLLFANGLARKARHR